jgi:hypothetical protein
MNFKVFRLIALGALAGCSIGGLPGAQAVTDAPMVAAAMDAYRAGDYPAFKAAVAAFDAVHAKPAPGERPDPCSGEGFARRRAAVMRHQLKVLGERKVFAMSEEARLSYFDTAFMDGAPNSADEPQIDANSLCGSGPEPTLLGLIDAAEHAAVLTAYLEHRRAWWDELQGRFEGSMGLRMQGAGEVLARNGLEGSRFVPSVSASVR